MYLLVIPVVFILTSCAGSNKIDKNVFDFSTTIQIPPSPKKQQAEKTQPKIEKVKTEILQKPKESEVKEGYKLNAPKLQKYDSVNRKFNLGYLAFNVADFYMNMVPIETGDGYIRYNFRFYSHSNGFIDYLFGWRSNTVAVVKVFNNKVVPEFFQNKIILKKKSKEVALDYNPKHKGFDKEEVIPPDNRTKRPAVPDNLKIGTFDFISAAVQARIMVIDAFKNDNFNDRDKYSFTLPIYDGRRRANANFEVDKKKIDGLIKVTLNEQPVAGYTEKELNEIKKSKRVIDIYLDTQTYWPVSAEGRIPIGQARAEMMEDCGNKSFEECAGF